MDLVIEFPDADAHQFADHLRKNEVDFDRSSKKGLDGSSIVEFVINYTAITTLTLKAVNEGIAFYLNVKKLRGARVRIKIQPDEEDD